MEFVQLSFPEKEQSLHLAQSMEPCALFEVSNGEALSANTLSQYNTLLRCENLFGLKALIDSGYCFDFIYIDPPYNTSSQFTFNDKHASQNQWLAMMTSRLWLARQVLAPEGLFCVSIDDREMPTLTILLREIFGRENHIGTLKWRKKRKPSFLDKHMSTVIEYVLVFCKDKNKLPKLKGPPSQEETRPVLNASNSIVERILPAGAQALCADGVFRAGVYKNKTLDFELLSEMIIQNGRILKDVPIKGRFRVNQDILNETVFITKKFGLRRHVLAHEHGYKQPTDDATVDFETNEDGESQLRKLFGGEKVFEFPKPVGFIKKLLKMYSSNKETISCLDFFAGSATLAQAVLELNQEQRPQKYSFCCIQNEEKTVTKSKYSTIADIAQTRIQLVEENYKILPKCKIFSP